MMNEGLEATEHLRVGSSTLRLPSNICTDQTIFNHIFSLGTWNRVLEEDQKQRIMQFLPAEILATPGGGESAMEDFLSGSLRRFGSNPLEAFFRELNSGGYDPEVRDMKGKIQRLWRREAHDRRKEYQTQLMQEVLLASQDLLQKLSQPKIKVSKATNPQPNSNVKGKGKNVKVQKPEGPKPPPTSKKKCPSGNTKPSPLRVKVAKRLHNEIQAMNQAFPPQAVSLTSEDGPSAPKKSKGKAKKATPKRPPKSGEIVNHVKPASDHQSAVSGPNHVRSGIKSEIALLKPPSIQMAKFPSSIPPSLLGVISLTQSPSGISNTAPPLASLQNHFESKVKQITVTTSSVVSSSNQVVTTPLISKQVMTKHVLKASPILASQLQAPIASSINRLGVTAVTTPGPTKVVQNHCVTTNHELLTLRKHVKDEESSSDEDEFEAIEPTIGFFSSVLPSSQSNKQTPKVSSSKSVSNLPSRNHHLPVNNKTPPIRKRCGKVVVGNTPKSNHDASVSVKVTHSRAIITTLPTSSSTPKLLYQKVTTPVSRAPTNVTTNHVVAVNKLQPITLSNLAQHQQQLNSKTYFKTSGASNSNFVSQSTVSSQPMVNGGSNVFSAAGARGSQGHFGMTMASSVASFPSNTHVNSVAGELRRVMSPLPLTLSDLSLSLNLGLEVNGDKLEDDKIDDLPVLDGSAFDSIPNLSDDLDVFDLDLVDGLCDFEVMLSEEKQYSSFFALIREVLCSTQNHRMTFSCLEKTVQKWVLSPSSELNSWFHRISGWNEALITALNFLAGNYQEIHPEDFVPYLEYKYKTKYYQWIGAGRDSDGNLAALCGIWLDNLDKLPPVKKVDGDQEEAEEEEDENEDSEENTEEVKKKYLRPKTPPPPRFLTEWTVRPSTVEEKDEFQTQEKVRFDNPHKAFTYRMHEYESVVGPVKGVYSNQTGVTNKARGHSLLVDDRPPYVTILALVRDSVARLPNGEGTRSEICEMLRDSNFLAPEASNVTLNSVVSGALDRLHYERDPCVRYDSHKKNWIYLHRDRSQEQFERLHHNRSYTKSTKSRNTGGRKSRKKTTSQTSNNDSSTLQSSGSSVSSTPGTTPKQVNTSSSEQTPLAQVTTSSPPTPSAKPPTTAFISKTTSPTVHFTLPSWTPNGHESGLPATQHSLPNVTPPGVSSFTTMSTNGGGTAPPPQNSVPPKSQTLDSPVGISSTAQTPPTNCTTPSLQQQSFILNNIFRLPNLKLPDNVRFMRLQTAPAGQVQQLNQLRLPQQRIVLRPAFPGYVPGQGVIFGQTPSGQTVIISAIGSPQVLNSTQSLQTQSTQSAEASTGSTFPSSALLRISNPEVGRSSTMAATLGGNVATVSGSSNKTSPTVHYNNVQTSPTFMNVPPGGIVQQRPPPVTSAGRSSSYKLLTEGTIGRSQMGNLVVPPSPPAGNTRLSGPPLVMRPSAVDIHSLPGRGALQGVKMIPMSSNSGSNQLFARLLCPAPSEKSPLPNTNSTQALL